MPFARLIRRGLGHQQGPRADLGAKRLKAPIQMGRGDQGHRNCDEQPNAKRQATENIDQKSGPVEFEQVETVTGCQSAAFSQTKESIRLPLQSDERSKPELHRPSDAWDQTQEQPCSHDETVK